MNEAGGHVTVNVFHQKGNWYRGNIHLHTTFSDGTLTPEEICAVYRAAGYDFLAIADHWYLTGVSLHWPDFVTLPAVEYHVSNYHIVGLGCRSLLPSSASAQDIIDALNQRGCVPILAHPYWSGITSSQLLELRDFQHLEIYNHVCQITKGKGYSSVHWDELLQSGRRLFGVAVDDAHHRPSPTQEDDLTGSYIMVKASGLNGEEILKAIKEGSFYSSTGVSIKEVSLKEKTIRVKTSPVKEIRFIGPNAQGCRVSGCGKEIEYAEYKMAGTERYLRIEAIDSQGHYAWSNPFFFSEI